MQGRLLGLFTSSIFIPSSIKSQQTPSPRPSQISFEVSWGKCGKRGPFPLTELTRGTFPAFSCAGGGQNPGRANRCASISAQPGRWRSYTSGTCSQQEISVLHGLSVSSFEHRLWSMCHAWRARGWAGNGELTAGPCPHRSLDW